MNNKQQMEDSEDGDNSIKKTLLDDSQDNSLNDKSGSKQSSFNDNSQKVKRNNSSLGSDLKKQKSYRLEAQKLLQEQKRYMKEQNLKLYLKHMEDMEEQRLEN